MSATQFQEHTTPVSTQKVGILVGGGPAPGINSVIAAATLQSIAHGNEVVGILDGFFWLMQGELTKIRLLTPDTVNRIHFQGGSILGTSRANPAKSPQALERTLDTLRRLGVTRLITIGGDDTASSAMKLEERAHGTLQVVHVPKTIDNDLSLPHGISTFGFQTARHYGVKIVKNLMVDAQTTSRWYFAVAMGRKAGHLALGIGKAAGSAITVIPEEFPCRPLKLNTLSLVLLSSIVKRISEGKSHGVAVLAEGLAELLEEEELSMLGTIERDEHGHLRLSELNIGDVLKQTVQRLLERYGIKLTIVTKNIGYELRCADPIPFDMEYTRDLGYCAAQYLLEGGSAAMVAIYDGRFTPLPFKDMLDPVTGKAKIRLVDITSESYCIAREYMARLSSSDLSCPEKLEKLANVLHVSPEECRALFQPVVSLLTQ
ncbi:MAG: 6-phosphofructokinase [Nitrospirae bacterium]|nr:MAG: 6-phosphofructokinase [Nitrospirota bacterium]